MFTKFEAFPAAARGAGCPVAVILRTTMKKMIAAACPQQLRSPSESSFSSSWRPLLLTRL